VRDDLDVPTAEAVASLRSAVATGAGVGDALRAGFARNAAFFTVFFGAVLLHRFGDRPDAQTITAFVARMCEGRSREQLGFEPREAEAVIRGAYGDLELARQMDRVGVPSIAIPVTIIENIFAASPPTPSGLDELLTSAINAQGEAWATASADLPGRPGEPRQERADEAPDEFDQAISSNPGDARAWARRGDARRDSGDYERALGDYGKAIALDPDNPFTLIWRAETLRCLGRYDAALADASRAIKLDPRNADVYAARAIVYRDMGRSEEAIADLDRVMSLDPAATWHLAGRALNYHDLGDYEKSLADYDQAIELNPADAAWMLVGRGELLRDMGRNGEARADFLRAVDLEPGFAPELEQYLSEET
jgi:tetratricopeptide (TPR) repeat protein